MGRGTGVRAASKSSIQIDFYLQGVRCRECIKLPPTPRNIKYAQNLKGTIEIEISKGTFDYLKYFPDSPRAKKFCQLKGDVLTVKEALNQYIQQAELTLEKSTYLDYRNSAMNHLLPVFGHLKLTELKLSHVKDWYTKLTVSRKRIMNMLLPLRGVLAEALENGDIEKNPLYGWTPKVKEKPKADKIDPFTLDEITEILRHCTGQEKNLYQFWISTGMRTSEIIALEWGDIDLINRKVRVQRAFVSGEIKAPKTESGNRDIDLNETAISALTAQKTHTYLQGKQIFMNPRTGEPWTGDAPIRKTAWKHTLKRAGVRYRYPYQLRHTYASLLLTAGEDPAYTAHQMGHKDWGMIRKTYARWMPTVRPDAGKKAETLMCKVLDFN